MIEIIGFDLEGCRIAQDNGAGRIELCLDPHLGGTTPDNQFIQQARKLLEIPLFVMIRPRGGDFVYTTEEFIEMQSSIKFCKSVGVDGVVFGILSHDGTVDINRNKTLRDLAKGMDCTFHRAFDVVNSPLESAELIYKLGFTRILTSGQEPTAEGGASLIKDLNRIFNNKMTILPGSGITSESLPALHQFLECKEYHSSAKIVDQGGKYEGVDASEVKAMSAYLNTFTGGPPIV